MSDEIRNMQVEHQPGAVYRVESMLNTPIEEAKVMAMVRIETMLCHVANELHMIRKALEEKK